MTKLTKWHVRPEKTQIRLGICPVWSESSLSAWRKLKSFATHWAHSEDSYQTGRTPRLIWVFAGRTVIMLVLSWGGSFIDALHNQMYEQKAADKTDRQKVTFLADIKPQTVLDIDKKISRLLRITKVFFFLSCYCAHRPNRASRSKLPTYPSRATD